MQKDYNMKFFTTIIIFLFFILSFVQKSDAQVYKWKKLRYEAIIGGGVSNFMGDVGAPKNEGLAKYFWTNVNAWRPLGVIGGRMAISERHKAKVALTLGYLYANDAYGSKVGNQFEVRTSIIELAAQYEFYIFREQQKRNIYDFLGASQRFKNFVLPTYVFVGVGGLYYNPKTLFDGEWVALQPYNTEIKPDGTEGYSRIAFTVPVGLGVKFKLTKYVSANIEAGWRLPFTDYIDDLGAGDYPDLETIVEDGDYTRAALSWRGHGYDRMSDELIEKLETQVPSGSRRGSGEWYDQYQFVTVTLNFKLKTGRRGQPRLRRYR